MSYVEKALAHKVSTSDAKPIWQEVFDHISPVRSDAVQLAQELFRKYTGSWAGLYSIGGAVKSNQLGQRGMGEINFRPYDFRTSTANKAPSLIGHPVSFEVVGPTLKNRNNDWQWLVTDNSATPGVGDVLTLDTISANQSPLGAPTVSAFTSIEDIYGITVLGGMPSEGLYLVVSETGTSSVNGGVTPSGLGDGTYGDNNPSTQTPCNPLSETSRYEVFRITSFSGTDFTLDAGKRIGAYFDTTAHTVIRAITVLRPKAARMQVVPQSGGLVYAVLPPERGSVGDHRPAAAVWYSAAPAGESVWGNDTITGGTFFHVDDYLMGDLTPNPRPLHFGVGHVVGEAGDGAFVPGHLGELSIVAESTALVADRLIHIYDVKSVGTPTASVFGGVQDAISDPGIDSLKGWYRIKVAVNGNGLTELVAQPSFDPVTGAVFDPPPDTYYLRTGERVQLKYTVHDSIDALWASRTLKLNDLAAAKLNNLIDPSWDVSHSSSVRSVSSQREPAANTKGHGRAVFDTVSKNPGSLNDLGFEMVLFPAKLEGGACTPDFSRPINPNNVVLDSTLVPSATQFIYVDYASGVCRFSHTPVVNADCEVCPDSNTLLATNNPRAEIVLYASFVPYSMEEGQNTFGVRVSGVFNDTLKYTLAAQTITIPARPNKFTVDVVELVASNEIPQTGFLDLYVYSSEPMFTYASSPTTPLHTVEYYRYEQTSGVTRFYCTGGGSDGDTVTVHGDSLSGYLVIRRDLVLPASDSGNHMGVRSDEDTSYGFAAISNGLTFAESRTERDPASGKITVTNELVESTSEALKDILSSWLISGATVTTIPGDRGVTISEGVFFINGRRVVVPPQTIPEASTSFPASSTKYIKLAGSGVPTYPPYYFVGDASDGGGDTVLIAQVTCDLTHVTKIVPLSLPMFSIDRRLTVYVGALESGVTGFPHFQTLAEAVAFAGALMNPVVGFDGLYITIQVVATTTETATPIALSQVSGITIQGSLGPVNGGGMFDTHGIHWASDSALFDVSGTTAVTIRDLKFVYSSAVAVRALTPDRGLFVNSTTETNNLHVSNISFDGGARAHFIGNFDALVNDSVFRDIRVTGVTDFGFQNPDMGSGFVDCLFDNCNITIANAQILASNLDSAISLDGAASVRNVIRDCNISGSYYGITMGGSYNRAEGCYVTNTILSGIFVTSSGNSHNRIVNNWFTDVFTSLARPKYGIYLQSGDRTLVSGNLVRLNISGVALAVTDYSCFSISGVDHCYIAGNDFDWTVYMNGSYNRVVDNTVTSGSLVVIDTGASVGRAIVKGNVMGLSYIFSAADSTVVADNIIPNGLAFGGAAIGLYLGAANNVATGNMLVGVISTDGAGTAFTVVGNQADVIYTSAGGAPPNDPDVAPYNSSVVGNRFTDTTAMGPIFGAAVDSAGRTANVKA